MLEHKQQHAFYGGIDLHARTLYLCILNHTGDKLLHREVPSEPAALLGHALYMKAIHGAKSKNDKIDAAKIAALLRGGMNQAGACGSSWRPN